MASAQFSLCWDNFHKNMSMGMQSLLETKDLVDVTLAVEGRYLKAHKMVLSVCSPYFRELFQSNPCKHPIVFMKDVSYIALSDLLRFMYQGEVQVAQENLSTFIKTAEALQIKGLMGDSATQNESEIDQEIEKPSKETTGKRSHDSTDQKRIDTSQPKRFSGPASKRPKFSNVTEPSVPSPILEAITEHKYEVASVNAYNIESSDDENLKVEPNESIEPTETDTFDESQLERYGDETNAFEMADETEDFSLMESSNDEPKPGTSIEGGDNQEVPSPTRKVSTLRNKGTWTSEQLQNAMLAVRNGKGKRQSAREYDSSKPKAPYSLKATLAQPNKISNCLAEPGETVRRLLDSTDQGALIKKSYGSSKFLRTNLCNLIIRHELQNSTNKSISTEKFLKLAQEINDIFMYEEAAIYYVPYCKTSNGKVVAAKGKLWSTYVHQRKLYKKAGLLTKPSSPQLSCSSSHTTDLDDNVDEEQCKDLILWLKSNTKPFDKVFKNWKHTVKQRLKFEGSIAEYFTTFPALKAKTGYILLESDFQYIHNDKDNCFFTKWPLFANIIFEALKKKNNSYLRELLLKEQENDLSENAVQIIALKYLPLLLQPPLINTKSKDWKLSKHEQLESFILSVNDISDVDSAVQFRAQRCHAHKLPAQPIPIFVGSLCAPNLETYVCVNETLYKTENPLKAVDVCFKLYHALNASYPAEADPSWLFIQRGIYGIHTKTDKNLSSVETLIADIKIAISN